MDLRGHLHHFAIGFHIQSSDAYLPGRHGGGPHDSIVIVAVFDNGLQGAGDA